MAFRSSRLDGLDSSARRRMLGGNSFNSFHSSNDGSSAPPTPLANNNGPVPYSDDDDSSTATDLSYTISTIDTTEEGIPIAVVKNKPQPVVPLNDDTPYVTPPRQTKIGNTATAKTPGTVPMTRTPESASSPVNVVGGGRQRRRREEEEHDDDEISPTSTMTPPVVLSSSRNTQGGPPTAKSLPKMPGMPGSVVSANASSSSRKTTAVTSNNSKNNSNNKKTKSLFDEVLSRSSVEDDSDDDSEEDDESDNDSTDQPAQSLPLQYQQQQQQEEEEEEPSTPVQQQEEYTKKKKTKEPTSRLERFKLKAIKAASKELGMDTKMLAEAAGVDHTKVVVEKTNDVEGGGGGGKNNKKKKTSSSGNNEPTVDVGYLSSALGLPPSFFASTDSSPQRQKSAEVSTADPVSEESAVEPSTAKPQAGSLGDALGMKMDTTPDAVPVREGTSSATTTAESKSSPSRPTTTVADADLNNIQPRDRSLAKALGLKIDPNPSSSYIRVENETPPPVMPYNGDSSALKYSTTTTMAAPSRGSLADALQMMIDPNADEAAYIRKRGESPPPVMPHNEKSSALAYSSSSSKAEPATTKTSVPARGSLADALQMSIDSSSEAPYIRKEGEDAGPPVMPRNEKSSALKYSSSAAATSEKTKTSPARGSLADALQMSVDSREQAPYIRKEGESAPPMMPPNENSSALKYSSASRGINTAGKSLAEIVFARMSTSDDDATTTTTTTSHSTGSIDQESETYGTVSEEPQPAQQSHPRPGSLAMALGLSVDADQSAPPIRAEDQAPPPPQPHEGTTFMGYAKKSMSASGGGGKKSLAAMVLAKVNLSDSDEEDSVDEYDESEAYDNDMKPQAQKQPPRKQASGKSLTQMVLSNLELSNDVEESSDEDESDGESESEHDVQPRNLAQQVPKTRPQIVQASSQQPNKSLTQMVLSRLPTSFTEDSQESGSSTYSQDESDDDSADDFALAEKAGANGDKANEVDTAASTSDESDTDESEDYFRTIGTARGSRGSSFANTLGVQGGPSSEVSRVRVEDATKQERAPVLSSRPQKPSLEQLVLSRMSFDDDTATATTDESYLNESVNDFQSTPGTTSIESIFASQVPAKAPPKKNMAQVVVSRVSIDDVTETSANDFQSTTCATSIDSIFAAQVPAAAPQVPTKAPRNMAQVVLSRVSIDDVTETSTSANDYQSTLGTTSIENSSYQVPAKDSQAPKEAPRSLAELVLSRVSIDDVTESSSSFGSESDESEDDRNAIQMKVTPASIASTNQYTAPVVQQNNGTIFKEVQETPFMSPEAQKSFADFVMSRVAYNLGDDDESSFDDGSSEDESIAGGFDDNVEKVRPSEVKAVQSQTVRRSSGSRSFAAMVLSRVRTEAMSDDQTYQSSDEELSVEELSVDESSVEDGNGSKSESTPAFTSRMTQTPQAGSLAAALGLAVDTSDEAAYIREAGASAPPVPEYNRDSSALGYLVTGKVATKASSSPRPNSLAAALGMAIDTSDAAAYIRKKGASAPPVPEYNKDSSALGYLASGKASKPATTPRPNSLAAALGMAIDPSSEAAYIRKEGESAPPVPEFNKNSSALGYLSKTDAPKPSTSPRPNSLAAALGMSIDPRSEAAYIRKEGESAPPVPEFNKDSSALGYLAKKSVAPRANSLAAALGMFIDPNPEASYIREEGESAPPVPDYNKTSSALGYLPKKPVPPRANSLAAALGMTVDQSAEAAYIRKEGESPPPIPVYNEKSSALGYLPKKPVPPRANSLAAALGMAIDPSAEAAYIRKEGESPPPVPVHNDKSSAIAYLTSTRESAEHGMSIDSRPKPEGETEKVDSAREIPLPTPQILREAAPKSIPSMPNSLATALGMTVDPNPEASPVRKQVESTDEKDADDESMPQVKNIVDSDSDSQSESEYDTEYDAEEEEKEPIKEEGPAPQVNISTSLEVALGVPVDMDTAVAAIKQARSMSKSKKSLFDAAVVRMGLGDLGVPDNEPPVDVPAPAEATAAEVPQTHSKSAKTFNTKEGLLAAVMNTSSRDKKEIPPEEGTALAAAPASVPSQDLVRDTGKAAPASAKDSEPEVPQPKIDKKAKDQNDVPEMPTPSTDSEVTRGVEKQDSSNKKSKSGKPQYKSRLERFKAMALLEANKTLEPDATSAVTSGTENAGTAKPEQKPQNMSAVEPFAAADIANALGIPTALLASKKALQDQPSALKKTSQIESSVDQKILDQSVRSGRSATSGASQGSMPSPKVPVPVPVPADSSVPDVSRAPEPVVGSSKGGKPQYKSRKERVMAKVARRASKGIDSGVAGTIPQLPDPSLQQQGNEMPENQPKMSRLDRMKAKAIKAANRDLGIDAGEFAQALGIKQQTPPAGDAKPSVGKNLMGASEADIAGALGLSPSVFGAVSKKKGAVSNTAPPTENEGGPEDDGDVGLDVNDVAAALGMPVSLLESGGEPKRSKKSTKSIAAPKKIDLREEEEPEEGAGFYYSGGASSLGSALEPAQNEENVDLLECMLPLDAVMKMRKMSSGNLIAMVEEDEKAAAAVVTPEKETKQPQQGSTKETTAVADAPVLKSRSRSSSEDNMNLTTDPPVPKSKSRSQSASEENMIGGDAAVPKTKSRSAPTDDGAVTDVPTPKSEGNAKVTKSAADVPPPVDTTAMQVESGMQPQPETTAAVPTQPQPIGQPRPPQAQPMANARRQAPPMNVNMEKVKMGMKYLEGQILDAKGYVSKVAENMETLESRITKLESKPDDSEAKEAALKAELDAHKKVMEEMLSKTSNEFNEKLSVLERKVSSHELQIEEKAELINSLEKKIKAEKDERVIASKQWEVTGSKLDKACDEVQLSRTLLQKEYEDVKSVKMSFKEHQSMVSKRLEDLQQQRNSVSKRLEHLHDSFGAGANSVPSVGEGQKTSDVLRSIQFNLQKEGERRKSLTARLKSRAGVPMNASESKLVAAESVSREKVTPKDEEHEEKATESTTSRALEFEPIVDAKTIPDTSLEMEKEDEKAAKASLQKALEDERLVKEAEEDASKPNSSEDDGFAPEKTAEEERVEEEARLKTEEEATLTALEDERIAREQAAAETARLKVLEEERVAKEKAAESARLEEERIAKEKEIRRQKEDETRIAAEKAEAERVAKEQAAAAEAQRVELERLEQERIAAEKAEAQRVEQERIAAEKAEAERLDKERIAAERADAERLAAEKAEAERLEQERVAAEKAEAERIAAEEAAEAARLKAIEDERIAAEAARLEQERLAAEKAEAERLEQERLAAEKAEAERLEAARLEEERIAAEAVAEQERFEEEMAEVDRLEQERIGKETTAAAEAERIAIEKAEEEARQMALQWSMLESAKLKALEDERVAEEKAEEDRLKAYEEELFAQETAESERLKALEEERLAKVKVNGEKVSPVLPVEDEIVVAQEKSIESVEVTPEEDDGDCVTAEADVEDESVTMKKKKKSSSWVMMLIVPWLLFFGSMYLASIVPEPNATLVLQTEDAPVPLSAPGTVPSPARHEIIRSALRRNTAMRKKQTIATEIYLYPRTSNASVASLPPGAFVASVDDVTERMVASKFSSETLLDMDVRNVPVSSPVVGLASDYRRRPAPSSYEAPHVFYNMSETRETIIGALANRAKNLRSRGKVGRERVRNWFGKASKSTSDVVKSVVDEEFVWI